MFITKKHLDRRTFLRGAFGTAIALPLLDAMIPAATAQTLTEASTKNVCSKALIITFPRVWSIREQLNACPSDSIRRQGYTIRSL